MTKIIYTNKTIKVRWLWIKYKVKVFNRLELCNTWETLWTITQRHTRIHTKKNQHSKEQSKLRFKTTDKLYYLWHENKTTNTHYIQQKKKQTKTRT